MEIRTHGSQALVAACIALGLFLSGAVSAKEHRRVIVNDQQLTPQQVWQLEQLHGESIPNGNYWLDWNTRVWGYKGGPAEGILGQPGLVNGTDSGSSSSSGGSFEDTTQDFCLRNGCSTPW